MRIIEIKARENGSHRNQSHSGRLPRGWAVVPEGMELENFPFGTPVIKAVGGVLTVTGWTPGTMPAKPLEETAARPDLAERVQELEEALELILSGETGEEGDDEAGA